MKNLGCDELMCTFNPSR